ncbi:MAG TPA: hypothetical protein VFL13_02885 [Candidatus Baltobacteraceae bacterium]|nr:hypothetical protein [Candidatus Baltobacteraceae bacterium]
MDAGDEDAAQVLASTYGLLQPAPDRPAHHNAFVRRLEDGRLHVRFDRVAIAAGERSAGGVTSAYYALKEIFARFAGAIPNAVAFYSALVEIDGRAVLLAGPASSGKTLLALHLCERGAKLLGDTTSLIDLRTGRVRALACRPSLRESALPLLPKDLRRAIEQAANVTQTATGRLWYALDASANVADPDGSDYPLGAVILLRERAPKPRLTPIDCVQALPALLQRAYSRPFQLLEMSAIKRAMRQVRCFELQPADPATSADLLMNGLRS